MLFQGVVSLGRQHCGYKFCRKLSTLLSSQRSSQSFSQRSSHRSERCSQRYSQSYSQRSAFVDGQATNKWRKTWWNVWEILSLWATINGFIIRWNFVIIFSNSRDPLSRIVRKSRPLKTNPRPRGKTI